MSKRFTEIEKWSDPWYRKLSCKQKCLWQFICDRCDNSGVWKADFELASFYIGDEIIEQDLTPFNVSKERIAIKGGLVIIKDFIPFQIGDFAPGKKRTNLQQNCIKQLKYHNKNGLNVTGNDEVYTCSDGITCIGIGKGIGISNKEWREYFSKIWQKYPKKTGKKAAFRHFQSSFDPRNSQIIHKALDNYLKSKRVKSGFIQSASTWFNNWQDWIDYTEDVCPNCKGKGKVTSTTGYDGYCSCLAGQQARYRE